MKVVRREAARYPIKVVLADEEAPPEITPGRPDGGSYHAAWIFFRVGGRPLGKLVIALDGKKVSSSSVGRLIREHLSSEPIRAKLRLADVVPFGLHLPFASVVIPTTCSRIEELKRSVDALNDQDYPDYEIVIVDNRSRPQLEGPSLTSIREVPRVRIVHEVKRGISSAKNRGILSAHGEVIAFTDDDIVVDRGWLRALMTPLAIDSTLNMVTGLVLPKELEAQSQVWFEEYAGGFGHGFESLVYVPVRSNHRCRAGRVRRVLSEDLGGAVREDLSLYSAAVRNSGGNIAIRASAFLDTGVFDVNLGAGTCTGGGEDLKFCANAFAAGMCIRYEPSALSFHIHRRTHPELVRQVRSWGVGLVAMLTAIIWDEPGRLFDILANTPRALSRVLRHRLRADADTPARFRTRLVWHELSGMLLGVPAYFLSRAGHRRGQSTLSRRHYEAAVPEENTRQLNTR